MKKNFLLGVATTLAAAIVAAVGVSSPTTFAVADNAADTTDRTFSYTQELQGKSVVFYGDSITARHGLQPFEKDYMQILQEEFGFYYSNQAVGGATWSVVGSSTNHLFTQMSKSEALYRDADCVSIFLGTNDFGLGREIGTPQDNGKDTVYGAIRTALDTIIEANPDVKIMLMTELNRYDFTDFNADDGSLTNVSGDTIEAHRNAVRTMAELYHCTLVDLSTLVNAANFGTYLNADKLHVSETGYYAIAKTLKTETSTDIETADRTFSYTEELQGKSIVFYGDSITARLGLKATNKDYMQLLQEEFGFYYSNQAISGTTWTLAENNPLHVFAELEKSEYLYRDADCVSIFLGTNDFGGNRELGTATDVGTDTVYGAMRKMLNTIITANPDVKIMLLTPINRYDLSSTTNAKGYTLDDYRDAIWRLATEYGCSVVDLSNVVTESNYATLLNSDKLHVVEAGYQAIANAIKNAE